MPREVAEPPPLPVRQTPWPCSKVRALAAVPAGARSLGMLGPPLAYPGPWEEAPCRETLEGRVRAEAQKHQQAAGLEAGPQEARGWGVQARAAASRQGVA